MYANWVTFNLGPGKREQATEMVKKFRPALEALKGFEGVTFLGNEETGEYGSLITWQTKEDADAAFQVVFPQLQEAVKGRVKEPPRRVLFEVIKP